MKSFRPKGVAEGSGEDFHGERRGNATHGSTTEPEARLYRKGAGKEAKPGFMGHVPAENRNGLVVTRAGGRTEWTAAPGLLSRQTRRAHRTVGADKSYNAEAFFTPCRLRNEPAQAGGGSVRLDEDLRPARKAAPPGTGQSQLAVPVHRGGLQHHPAAEAGGGMRVTPPRGPGARVWGFTDRFGGSSRLYRAHAVPPDGATRTPSLPSFQPTGKSWLA